MTIAIFSLIGVLLGGLISGGAPLILERRRERGAARRAKRLVAGELLQAGLIFRTISTLKTWPYYPDVDAAVPTSAWQEHRAYLADVLDDDLWNQLVMTYTELEIDRARFVLTSEHLPGTPLTDDVIEQHKKMAMKLEELRQKLGGAGGWLEDLVFRDTSNTG